eukprot:TRINITY_DN9816_c0_g2_i2.p1 TRINITY_DN9816_c0_g2~~TRINITY_DN9816_c0_g2_i2.p1  ORF type:complete len:494 (-),score=93.54 TRINITY_DN9816_c0_g2_i2:1008-2489(-)
MEKMLRWEKNYFEGEKLEDIIFKWGMERQNSSSGREQLDSFLDFLYGILDPDPETRWTPRQALQHPFIKKESFLGPFVPQPDPIRPHIRQQGYQNQQGQDFAGSLGNMQWSLAQQAQILAQAQTLAMLQFSPGSQQFTTGSLQQLSHLQSQIVGSFSNNFSAGSFPVGNNLLMPNVLSTSTPQHGVMPTLGSAYQYLPLGASFQQMTQLLQQHQFQQQQQQQLQQQQQEQQSQSQQPPQLSLSQQQQLLQQHQQQHMSQSSCSSFNQLHSSLTPEFGYGTSQNTPLAMHTKHAQHVSELKKMNSSTRTMASVDEEIEMEEEVVGEIEPEIGGVLGELEGGSSGAQLSPSAEAEWNPLFLDEGEEREEGENENELEEQEQQQQQMQLQQSAREGVKLGGPLRRGGSERDNIVEQQEDLWTRQKIHAQPVPIRGRSKSFHWINDSCQSLQLGFGQGGEEVKGEQPLKTSQGQQDAPTQLRRIQRNQTFADFGLGQ